MHTLPTHTERCEKICEISAAAAHLESACALDHRTDRKAGQQACFSVTPSAATAAIATATAATIASAAAATAAIASTVAAAFNEN